MSGDPIEPDIDDQLIGDFLVEHATINSACIVDPDMIIYPSFATARKLADFGLFIHPRWADRKHCDAEIGTFGEQSILRRNGLFSFPIRDGATNSRLAA